MDLFANLLSYFQTAFASAFGPFFSHGSFFSIGPMYVAFMIAFVIIGFRLKSRRNGKNVTVGQVLRMLFPRRVFLHDSAKADYLIYLINNGLLFFLTISVVLTPAAVTALVVQMAEGAGISTGVAPGGWAGNFVLTILMVLAWDFSATYAHYLKHKIPFLWEFHKVHHSAEVMTPITAMRRHPVEALFGGVISALGLGIVFGLWQVSVGTGSAPITLFGSLAGIYLWRLLGYNLRHTHIWISYGDFWNRIFISPAQHQIHHSVAPAHYDTNFGHIFSFWDALLGTQYLPRHDERVKFGIEAHEMDQFKTLGGIYLTPFVKSVRTFGTLFHKTQPD